MNGYIVLIDFSKFFPNCSHEVINSIHNKYINDSYTKKVIEDYLYVKDIGIALGVEIAQREALMVPNKLDTFITNLGYPIIRYMDDTFFICPTYDEANNVLNEYIKLSESLHIIVNRKKTKMIHKKINVEEIKTTIVSFCAYLNMGNSYKYIKYLNDKLNKLGIEYSK